MGLLRDRGGDMSALALSQAPEMSIGMLIRRPIREVFQAFVNPEVTTQFWFTRSSGPPEVGQQVQWDWETYDVSAAVTVKAVEPNERIEIEWPSSSGSTTVEWVFVPQEEDTTFVKISEAGFIGSGDELVQQVTDSTEGFTLVLAGLKALLEHGIQLNLVADRFPTGRDEHEPGGRGGKSCSFIGHIPRSAGSPTPTRSKRWGLTVGRLAWRPGTSPGDARRLEASAGGT
jgi:uncharacterized protein YndB with AHSA1/START domain